VIACRGQIQSVDGRTLKVSVQAFRRGDGPDGLDLKHEEVALTGEADIELPE
jgi:hypothetical protein